MSSIRDSAARLVALVRTQILAQAHGLAQSDIELRRAHDAIEKNCDELMAEVHKLEAVVAPLEEYAQLLKDRIELLSPQVIAVARAIVRAIDSYVGAPADPPPATKAEGFARAGDVQLPLGDRREDPPAGNPPP